MKVNDGVFGCLSWRIRYEQHGRCLTRVPFRRKLSSGEDGISEPLLLLVGDVFEGDLLGSRDCGT